MSDEISYAEWGVGFFTEVLTVDRVLAGISVLSGQPIDLGPLGVGPGRIAKLTANGHIGTAVGDRVSSSPVTFRVSLPVALSFMIDLGVDKHRFEAELTVPLVITARAHADLSIALDIEPPTTAEVVVRLRAQGLRASITQHAANVEGELKRFVSKYVARELDKPYVRSARIIDVSAAVDQAVRSLAPRRPDPERVVADFDEALEQEIRDVDEALFPERAQSSDS